jgi:hypothetical protein
MGTLEIRTLAVLAVVVSAGAAWAQEPVGCDKFKWPLDRERALLAVAAPLGDRAEVPPLAGAVKLTLLPLAEARLPAEPSRKPRSADSHAGVVRYAAVPHPGTYRITLSAGAWIDVIQDGQTLKSGAFSGATGCEGVRKSVKFDLSAAPFVIEISGARAKETAIAVTPD